MWDTGVNSSPENKDPMSTNIRSYADIVKYGKHGGEPHVNDTGDRVAVTENTMVQLNP